MNLADIERDRQASEHNRRNALHAGHSEACEKVAGIWTTIHGVPVNWPTLFGRPHCTCGLERLEAHEAYHTRFVPNA